MLAVAGTVFAVPVGAQSDIAVTKTAANTVAAGQQLTYDIAVEYRAPNANRQVTLTDPLPSNTTFVSIKQTAGPTATLTTPNVGTSGTITASMTLAKPQIKGLRNPTLVGNTIFLSAYSDATGTELWKSDGTAAGTVLVKDIRPGTGGSFLYNLINVNGTLFFIAYTETNGQELWKSDGTAAGTILVKDIRPGSEYSSLRDLTNVNGTLFFVADNGTSGSELWKSNGTAAGTVLVKDIRPGGDGSSAYDLTNVNGTLFFGANNGTNGEELWKSNGTAAGTVLVKDILPGSHSSPANLTSVGGTLFFSAYDYARGRELWKSDGTAAGTILVKDILPGGKWSSPDELTNVNGTLFFIVNNPHEENQDTQDRSGQLWKSDGTAAGTVMIKAFPHLSRAYFSKLINVNGTLFFTVSDVSFRVEYDWLTGTEYTYIVYSSQALWKSNGTDAGTVLVKDGVFPAYLTNVNGTLFFALNNPSSPGDGGSGQLWKSDGTPAGTVLVRANFPVKEDSSLSLAPAVAELINVNGTLFFTVIERWFFQDHEGGYYVESEDSELWKSNGTWAGTVPVFPELSTDRASFEIVVQVPENASGTLSNTANLIISPQDSNADNNTSTAVTTIAPPLQKLSINDVSIREGNPVEGTTNTINLLFTVLLSKADTRTVTVQYATANGSGVAGSDYTAQAGILTIPAGQTTGTITVPVIGDTVAESNDTLFVNLSNPTNATISDNQGVGTIINDDAGPGLSINDVTVTEGNTGTVNATFTVTLSAASNQTVTANAISANGSARSPGDYTATGARLTFAPGETSKTVSVPVKGDLLDEANEVFYVLLSSANSATLARGRGVGTITDNDAPPTVSIDDISIGEGNSGQRVASLRLRLSALTGQSVRVSYATAVGTINPATAGNDYVAVAPTVVAFNAGSTVAYARVLLNGDLLTEANETFLVNLSSPVNATIGDGQATGTILNDDSAPALSINDVSITEGNTGTRNLVFTVTLSKASGQNISVNYATANGMAVAGSDYVAKTGTLTFAPGSLLTRTVSIVINGDAAVEGNETLLILLSGATNASISKARGVGTITNDDSSG
jgi:uncharacterized repeat protein (TIGR01451 family)